MPQSVIQILFLFCLVCVSSSIAFGAGEADPSFNAGVSRAGAIGYATAIQSDGRILWSVEILLLQVRRRKTKSLALIRTEHLILHLT